MDDMQKSKMRLTYWIEHNVDHLRAYEEMASLLDHVGNHEVAATIRKGIELIGSANREFEKALHDLSVLVGDEHGHEHSHSHGHEHTHGHGHSHSHDEAHTHEHPHEREK